ncbi:MULTISPECIES: 2,3-bisphosphoglycerate-independent phosphoglycerate mutase [unclassified Pedobacter]|uniref:2,3-bisphosphoglycerate-independent phosphoglycerate mutase n=1 Tax=unclassified Pedobacter TaxID=2628915 RepID=UPI001422A39E|nr:MULTISPECIES: 2,3-bisphosphoglycerate-independent phosphoglycerate mutase [unclassified Pedobacter]NII83974.1 2,3-bisphosphoglycerate-independent phosphoglycerate mutase [Pedobacter sp. SG908]NMN37848.1 2,3-bisphosphoglycerate-independent phosphoglycerate mutase [Pedobacter sp. SG918]
MVNNKKLALIILDGWGYGKQDNSDAAYAANTPFFDSLLQKYPNSKLEASGEAVGLPAGQMGNSEVGHMNLGAGRVVYQELGRINKSITDRELHSNPVLVSAFDYAKQHNKAVHFIGLVSNGGVHAHIEHLKALCDAANEANVPNTFIHAFLDGRDTDPNSGLGFITDLENHIQNTNAKLATMVGRYYAMDRDNRWERVKQAYDVMVNGIGEKTQDALAAIKKSYADGITDEFLKPIVLTQANGAPVATIQNDDVVICFNFRTDRGREITTALTQKDFPEQQMHKLPLYYVTMTTYDESFEKVNVIFTKDDLTQTIGEVLANNNKNQIRIAETEKYPHVTFFFSGGREAEFKNEKRLLIPSPKVATYDLQPEMSAAGITDAITKEMETGWADFICLNFANPDMVGHTGVFEAVVKAVETADKCAEAVVKKGLERGYSFILLADHGNSEFMINGDGSANTAHTTNLVPCILIDKDYKTIADGKLGDIAPTILKILGVAIPAEMTGNVLV